MTTTQAYFRYARYVWSLGQKGRKRMIAVFVFEAIWQQHMPHEPQGDTDVKRRRVYFVKPDV